MPLVPSAVLFFNDGLVAFFHQGEDLLRSHAGPLERFAFFQGEGGSFVAVGQSADAVADDGRDVVRLDHAIHDAVLDEDGAGHGAVVIAVFFHTDVYFDCVTIHRITS